MSKVVTYVELDLPYCANTYGTAPCTASIGVTGADRCYNCRKTCQDIANFSATTVTLRFAKPAAYLPRDVDANVERSGPAHVHVAVVLALHSPLLDARRGSRSTYSWHAAGIAEPARPGSTGALRVGNYP